MRKIENLKKLFLLTIACMPLYLVRIVVFGVPSNVFEILALLTIILTILLKKKLILKEFFLLPKIFFFSIALIIVGLLFSIFFNNDHRTGFGILKGWFLIPLLFSFSFYAVFDSAEDIKKIFGSIYFSTVLVGVTAIVYKILGVETYDHRLTGFYSSPNYLAMYLAPGIFFGIYFLTRSLLKNCFAKSTLFYSLTLLLIFVPFYYTYSYSAWLALIVSLAATTFALKPSKKMLLWTASFSILCALALFFSQANTQKFSAITNLSARSSFASRLMIWNASLLLIEKHPFVGIGPGNFQAAYLAVQPEFTPYLEWSVPQPHNILLAFWLQAGLLGLLGFLGLLFFIFNTLWKLFDNKKSAAFAAPLFGFFVYTALHGLFDTTYWKNDLAVLFWLCFFLILMIKRFSKTSPL
jgi:O-antigen ligase